MTNQFVVFALDGGRYALRLSIVERVVRMVAVTPLPEAPASVLGVVNVGGRVIPVINLRARFGLRDRAPELDDRLMIVELPHRAVGLVVDQIIGITPSQGDEFAAAGEVMFAEQTVEGILNLEGDMVVIHNLEALLIRDGDDTAVPDLVPDVSTEDGEEGVT